MSYILNASGAGFAITLAAGSREEFVKDLITALLEASYAGAAPAGPAEGLFVPIQACGNDERELISNLVADTLRAVAETDGMLQPPRWLAFDVKRTTANLPVAPSATRPRALGLRTSGGAVTIESGLPSFRATVELAAGERAA